jgi:hypothetical protein
MKVFEFFLNIGKMVGAGARARDVTGAEIFDKLNPEPYKNGPAPQN